MAASVASESIMFIGAVIAATAFAGVVAVVAGALGQDVRVHGQHRAEALQADITLINDPGNVVQSPSLVLYAKNTGSATLVVADTVVIVNGAVVGGTTFDVLESDDDAHWRPHEVLELDVPVAPGTGDHRARVVAGPGAAAELSWSV